VRVCPEFRSQFACSFKGSAGVDDIDDQSHVFGIRGRDISSGEDVLLSLCFTNQPREQPASAIARDKPDVDELLAHERILLNDSQVTGQREVTAAPIAGPFTGGNGRLVAVIQGTDDILDPPQVFGRLELTSVAPAHVAHVGTAAAERVRHR